MKRHIWELQGYRKEFASNGKNYVMEVDYGFEKNWAEPDELMFVVKPYCYLQTETGLVQILRLFFPEDIAREFPNLAPLVRFHRCDPTGLPNCYEEMAVHAYDAAHGKLKWVYDTDPVKTFYASICWPNCPSSLPSEISTYRNIKPWLRNWEKTVKADFRKLLLEFKIRT